MSNPTTDEERPNPTTDVVDPENPDLLVVAGGSARAVRCIAHTTAAERCRRPAIRGGAVCTTHGGNAPQVRQAAYRRLVREEQQRQLGDLEVRQLGDPVVELADVAAQAVALMEWAAAWAAEDADNGEWLARLERAMDRAGRLLETCGRLGLEQRRVQIEEAQGRFVGRWVLATLRHLGEEPDTATVQAALDAGFIEAGAEDA